MDSHNSMKINKVLQTWPKGTVAVHAWLKAQGVSRKLAEQYRRREWIDAIGRGAFIRRGDKVEWPGAVYAIQTASEKPIHPGGRTALELHGLAHFLGLNARAPVYLYGSPAFGCRNGSVLTTGSTPYGIRRRACFRTISVSHRDRSATLLFRFHHPNGRCSNTWMGFPAMARLKRRANSSTG